MHKSFLLLVVLLFVLPSDPVQAQAAPSKTQPATNTNDQTDPKVIPGSSEPNPEAKSFYEDGIKRLEMGQVSEAVERFQQALKMDPEYGEAYSALGRAFFKLRQWDNAVGPLRRAMALKAKEREKQDALQKKRLRVIEPGATPASPASKPQPTNSKRAANTPGSVSVKIEAGERTTPKWSVSTPQVTLNKSLPTPRINAEATVTTLDSELTPPQLPRVEAGDQANIKFDNLLNSPPPPVPENAATSASKHQPVEVQIAKNVPPSSPMVEDKPVPTARSSSSTDEIALTNIYRVGSKDVLDIQLNNSQPQQTTVFTVTQSGLLEHPHLSKPLSVTGLTVEEIRAKIEEDLKNHALIENPKVFIGVLEHASHSIVVDGLVKAPGTKLLKSEAIPLAVVLAEAQPLLEATRVTVARNGLNQILETNLSHTADMSFLVHPGDIVTLHPHVDEFLYIGGNVKFPGEKRYRVGLTLLQAIIAAGGATSKSKVAEIARDDGELVRTRFDLKAIQAGKAADPLVRPRDRIILH